MLHTSCCYNVIIWSVNYQLQLLVGPFVILTKLTQTTANMHTEVRVESDKQHLQTTQLPVGPFVILTKLTQTTANMHTEVRVESDKQHLQTTCWPCITGSIPKPLAWLQEVVQRHWKWSLTTRGKSKATKQCTRDCILLQHDAM